MPDEPVQPPPAPRSEAPSSSLHIEPQYLQAAMQYWTNLNAMIWTQLGLVFAIQSGATVAAYGTRGSIASYPIMPIAFVLTCAFLWHVKSQQDVRTELTRQCNYLAAELMKPFFEGRSLPGPLKAPFQFYDLKEDGNPINVRRRWGIIWVFMAVAVVDAAIVYVVTHADRIYAGMPVLKIVP